MKAFAVLAVAALLAADAVAQPGGGGAAAPMGPSLPAPGLSVVFEGNATCPPIASPYGAPTRYDGSQRRTGAAEGLHGGIDLTLDEGTALRAIAPGRVFSAGEGGMMEGIFVWILHLPQATGLGFPFLAKYQHLREPSPLRAGETVRLGQEIARSGRTGTVGGHYFSRGYPHLHLGVRALTPDGTERAAASSGDFRMMRDSILVDPLTVYVPGLKAPADAAALPADRKVLRIASVDAQGRPMPADARVVWPVACR
jgi:murein DD-endopeptidase MepM/ murein hydrolase activator NlpD